MKQSAPPFAIFFSLAALDAIIVGVAWVVALCGGPSPSAIAEIVEWHQRELLFGFVAAALAGFLLTALPRWTGRPLPKGAVPIVLASWVAARFAPAHPSVFAPLAAAPGVILALLAAFLVWRARDLRNVKTATLLALYASAGVVCLSDFFVQRRAFATTFAIATMIGLLVLIGGRVTPALTARFDELRGVSPFPSRRESTERVSALLVAASLGCWLLAPEGAVTASLLLTAGASQIARMASWFGRRTLNSPPLLALYAAYASVPVGFGLLALHALLPERAPASAGLHVWTVGGFGGMILAIMASMIRKRGHRAFTPSPAAEAAVVFCLVAGAARVGAAFSPEPRGLLFATAIAWSSGFALFLFAFRAPLVGAFRKRAGEQRHNPRTGSRL